MTQEVKKVRRSDEAGTQRNKREREFLHKRVPLIHPNIIT